VPDVHQAGLDTGREAIVHFGAKLYKMGMD